MTKHGKVLSLWAVFGGLLLSAPPMFAQSFNFTFTDGSNNIVASGEFDVSAGMVTGGYASVNASDSFVSGPFASGVFDFVPTTFRVNTGTDLIVDSLYSASDPHFDTYGIAFGNGPTGGFPQYNYGINIWGNGPGNYTLFEAGQLSDGSGHVYNELDGGSLNLTEIPEPSTYAVILGLVTLDIVAIRRRKQAQLAA